jgi:hypothetical protein
MADGDEFEDFVRSRRWPVASHLLLDYSHLSSQNLSGSEHMQVACWDTANMLGAYGIVGRWRAVVENPVAPLLP